MGNSQTTAAGSSYRGSFSNEEHACLMEFYHKFSSHPNEQGTFIQVFMEGDDCNVKEMESFWQRVFLLFQLIAHDPSHQRRRPRRNSAPQPKGPAPMLSEQQFIQGMASFTRGSSTSILNFIFRVFARDGEVMRQEELKHFLTVILYMADKSCCDDSNSSTNLLSSTVQSLMNGALSFNTASSSASFQWSTMEGFTGWIRSQFPLLHTLIKHWMINRCFACLNPKHGYHLPRMAQEERSSVITPGFLVALSFSSTILQRDWCRLYTSEKDGLSFNRLCHHALGYAGPTVIVCQDQKGAVFGMYSDSGWKDSKSFFGGTQCFLFQLLPTFAIYRPKLTGAKNFMYLNTKGVSLPRGFGMGGGSTDSIRLFFDEDFEHCVSRKNCLSFEAGALSSEKEFQVDLLEVWGVGNDDASSAQAAYRAENKQLLDRARKVDKAKFVSNEFDKEFLFSKTFGHGADVARVADDEQH